MSEQTRRLPRIELRKPFSTLLRWRGSSGEHDGCIKDLTTEGCFLNTLGAADVNEVIRFTASLPTDELVELRGRVVRHQTKPAGFGLRFEDLTEREHAYLSRLILDASKEIFKPQRSWRDTEGIY